MHFHFYESSSKTSAAAAEWITAYIAEQIEHRDRFTLLLSGGNTPKELYSILATDTFINRIEWQRLHIFFGDERFVPFDDARNNGKMAYDHLLKTVPVPRSQIHFIATNSGDQQQVAESYEQLLREYFPGSSPTFDLSLLGMGDDGHTLSLFPHSPAIYEKTKWVVPSIAPVEPVSRVTLTAPIVKLSACIIFLVTGGSKAKALHELVQGEFNPDLYPSQIISRDNDNIHLFADRNATLLLNTYT